MEIDAGSWSGSSYNFGYNGMLKEGIGKSTIRLNVKYKTY